MTMRLQKLKLTSLNTSAVVRNFGNDDVSTSYSNQIQIKFISISHQNIKIHQKINIQKNIKKTIIYRHKMEEKAVRPKRPEIASP